MLRDWIEPLRKKLGQEFLRPVKGKEPLSVDFTTGDAGFFGPDSVAWIIHADYPAMLIGGVSAILLQALHPLAMAGVYDHSNFREDPFGRLKRTASFLAGTTYGSTEKALGQIELVKRIHKRVVGTAPDGRPYSAQDPALLTWIHTAEVYSFLRGYQRYSRAPLSLERQDQYLREISQTAEKLGAIDVPKTVNDAEQYFQRLRPELTYGAQAREAISFLRKTKAPNPAMTAAFRVIFEAATELLPDWARELMGEEKPRSVALLRPAIMTSCDLVRWAIKGSGVVDLSRERAR